MHRGSRRQKQAPLHHHCVSTSLKRAPFVGKWTGLHVQTSVPCTNESGCTPREVRKGNSDAVKIQQLNSPVTMSPVGTSSGKGEGPRETAGRSN